MGAASITANGQPVTGFISNKAQAVLYYLAATGQPQAREVLATLLWTNSEDAYAKKNLRNVLSNLRTLLGAFLEINRERVALQTQLVEPIDALRFVALIKEAAQAPPTSSLRHTLLVEAVALYRGNFLDGFHLADADAFDEWLRSERVRFQRLALQALTELVSYSLEHAHYLEGITYATQLLALDPLHEEMHRQLMLLLALDGQQSAALAHYRSCQRLLLTELGVAPDPETQNLLARIQAGEFTQRSTNVLLSSPQRSPQSVSQRTSHMLPAELTGFVGRVDELAQLHQRLADPACRLLTIIGMGGVGKTRLALRAAHAILDFRSFQDKLGILDSVGSVKPIDPAPQNTDSKNLKSKIPNLKFPDGVYFISLAALEPMPQIEHLLATTVAAGLQIPLTGAATPTEQLIQALYEKELLLLLDNCEHLPVAAFISPLLQQTRHLKLLVTSRTRLNVRGEQLLTLSGLTTPAPPATQQAHAATALNLNAYSAIRLFVQQIQAIVPDFRLDDATASAVTQICRLLHGLPLGLELAATWARLLPLEEIAQEIQQNLDFLDNTLFEAPAHQRSLRAVFNHSWHLLSPAEQQVLRRLAVFRGGFTRDAAMKVADATLPMLATLTDKSLLQRSEQAGTANSALDTPGNSIVRYELQPLIRQYAAEQLLQAGETAEFQLRHAAYMAEFLAAQRPVLQSIHQQAALRAIHAEIENVRAAWQWLLGHLQANQIGLAQIEQPVSQSFDSLFHFYDMRSWFQEGEALFGQLAHLLPMVTATQESTDAPALALGRLQAKAQARQGWFAFHLGRYDESRHLLETSLHNLRQLQAEAETVFNLNYLGALLRHLGEFAAAEQYLQSGLTVAQSHGDRLGVSIALNTLGHLAFLQGDFAQTQSLCRQALTIKQAIGDRWGMTYSLTNLGRVAKATGDHSTAEKLFEESLAICQEIGDQRGAAIALQNWADIAQQAGQLAIAQARYTESLQIYRAIGSRAEASLIVARLEEVAHYTS